RRGRSRIASGRAAIGSCVAKDGTRASLTHYSGAVLARGPLWYKCAVPPHARPKRPAIDSGGRMKSSHLAAVLVGAALAFAASAQTKWDMPTAYPPTNFHTENIAQFVADVDKATGGKLKITVHSNASLFKANEIKRAVQTEQAQIGEILISAYSNEDPVFGVD